MWCFVSLFLVVSTNAVDCLERIVSEMTYYVSSGTFNPTHSPTLTAFDCVAVNISCYWYSPCIYNLNINYNLAKIIMYQLATCVCTYNYVILWYHNCMVHVLQVDGGFVASLCGARLRTCCISFRFILCLFKCFSSSNESNGNNDKTLFLWLSKAPGGLD